MSGEQHNGKKMYDFKALGGELKNVNDCHTVQYFPYGTASNTDPGITKIALSLS